MTGMERNSEVVQLAAYAPLLANINHQGALCPTNLIIYDNHRCPSASPWPCSSPEDSHTHFSSVIHCTALDAQATVNISWLGIVTMLGYLGGSTLEKIEGNLWITQTPLIPLDVPTVTLHLWAWNFIYCYKSGTRAKATVPIYESIKTTLVYKGPHAWHLFEQRKLLLPKICTAENTAIKMSPSIAAGCEVLIQSPCMNCTASHATVLEPSLTRTL